MHQRQDDPAAPETGSPPALPINDRLFVVAGLAGIVAVSWAYLMIEAGRMGNADMVAMVELRPRDATGLILLFLMWAVMMVAMMLPSATPTLLLYAAIARKLSPELNQCVVTAAFALGYIVAWTVFSLGATILQWGLEQLTLLSPMIKSSSYSLGGVLLIAAGVYQWSPAKNVCLKHCQTPLLFISQRWRSGADGALWLGLSHGLYCIGCCWVLMGLLFVGGVMNLLWVAAIAIFVLIENVAPFGREAGRGVGLLLIGTGVYVFASSFAV